MRSRYHSGHRRTPTRVAVEFGTGAGSLTSVALLIGVARAIQVVLDEGDQSRGSLPGLIRGALHHWNFSGD